MIKLISLDTSTSKTGWCLFQNAEYVTHGILDMSRINTSEKRIKDMCLGITALLTKWKPDIIVIEKLNVSRNMVTTRALCKVIDTVYCYSILNDIFYYEISPSEWRGKLGIQANGRKRAEYKNLSMKYVKENLGLDVTDDISDSICAGIGYIKYLCR